MLQSPSPGTTLRRFAGDVLTVTLQVPGGRTGHAFVRTNIRGAATARRERLAAAAEDRPPLATDWTDLPMAPAGPGLFSLRIPLPDVGLFAAKAFFLTDASSEPLWPDGPDLRVKVAPASSLARNSIYTAFTRCFQSPQTSESRNLGLSDTRTFGLPSGTFRSLASHLDEILVDMRFGILQLLPIHPAPTVYARMGRYGSPFAGLDFLAVDPAYAEFDPAVPPIGQFRELLDAVHARGARLFLDLPANHTGWASTLLAHHPEWFRRDPDGRFHSPGAWGVVWEDLVELDYSRPGLREFMASVFEYWCEEGVDGFRCDAGYMVPQDVWIYIVDRVRSRFPETVFLLEGLGGKISVTRSLLDTAGLDWAYSEIFQTEDRSAFEHYLPGAQTLSDEVGPLVHFAETHDNLRLAARSPAYSRLRVRPAALLSAEGAFGITSGVEWFATEKIDVHDATDLRWGSPDNQLDDLRRLNDLLASHPAFGPGSTLRMVQAADGNSLAVLRTPPTHQFPLLILANLDPDHPQPVNWPASAFDTAEPVDLLSGAAFHPEHGTGGLCRLHLAPGQVLCLAAPGPLPAAPPNPARQRIRAALLRAGASPDSLESIADTFSRDPYQALCSVLDRADGAPPRITEATYPADLRRVIPVPPGHYLLLRSPSALRAGIPGGVREESIPLADGSYALLLPPLPEAPEPRPFELRLIPGIADPASPDKSPAPARSAGQSLHLLALGTSAEPAVRTVFPGAEIRRDPLRSCLLANGRGAMSHVRLAWPGIASRYDALLAANPDPAVPCDRWMLLSRCRLWLRNRAYSSPVDTSCLESFVDEGDAALWRFRVPIGLGDTASLSMRLRLLPGENRCLLGFALETPSSPALELIVRPDIESRSFHELTKAFTGPETEWPRACMPHPDGLDFLPHGRPGLRLRTSSGAYVHEPEWSYCVALPFDAQRGQDPQCDLFSPGYFRIPLSTPTTLSAEMHGNSANTEPRTSDSRTDGLTDFQTSLFSSLRAFLVARDDVATIIAGYPWFLDWGRDTFIVLRGMVAAGMREASLAIVQAFARFERDGTLPNMIRGNDDSNRDTSDAPLWFFAAVQDLCARYGRRRILSLDCGGRTLLDVLVGIADGYRRGTPNGIAMDPATALVYSPPHFTWMDTNHPAGTPRDGYPVEIQALWIRALRFLARVRPADGWGALAGRAAASVRARFWLPGKGHFSDCLFGRDAARAVPDDSLRPNQLFLFTLGALDPALPEDRARIASSLRACARLLVPGAIRTLDDAPVSVPLPIDRHGHRLNDPLRPYWGAYAGDEDTRRKPAYHNGTAWTWPFPSYAEALVRLHGPAAVPEARALLASAIPLLEGGAVGHLPEILDGDAPHAQRGCDAQAWGASEFLRVWLLLSKH